MIKRALEKLNDEQFEYCKKVSLRVEAFANDENKSFDGFLIDI